VFDVEFYAYGNDEQPAEKFILGLSNEDAARLFGFVDNIASDWPLRRSEGTDWKPLGGPAKGCHEVRLRIWKKLHRSYVRLDGERRRLVLLDGDEECRHGVARDGLSTSGPIRQRLHGDPAHQSAEIGV
jgi:hypothetical protein